ncbi:endo alpha-1,4 polygalactosaminidase [Microbacterium sp. cx-55]|uniref:endo alpha-1,4 polygalactosaminidase n=1 Tax=Microbacterium sp. cx-55 TaxID=2875948 RepID=UPI001CBD5039|nr:endo alpha-1,4 polygalactosaminidase [Microbacterium sp. cx-55]UGB34782.1 endo alpha-1,4 polygalactosaminidase [Microbacterium sp. cx-55]
MSSLSTRLLAAFAVTLAVGGVAGCTSDAGGHAASVALPPAGAPLDYQLGGAYDPDPRVEIVDRDRAAEPAEGRYSICYLNGFQTQPGERADWPGELVLTDAVGDDVIDPDWPDESLLDTGSAANRAAIAERIGGWISGCAEAGFQAVEFDNLDSYTRSDGALELGDNLALAELLVTSAHAHGLAAGQKNAAEDAARLRRDAGFDFAVVEECAVYRECGAYTAVYGPHVVDIEYTDALPRPFAEMCADEDSPASMVLRDRGLAPAGDAAHVFELCP